MCILATQRPGRYNASAALGLIFFWLIFPLFLLAAAGIANLVFAIVGGIKANNGEVWKYPLSFSFLK